MNFTVSYHGNMLWLIFVNAYYLRCEGLWIEVIELLDGVPLDELGQLEFVNYDNSFLHIPVFPLHDLLLLFCFPTTAHLFRAASATNTGASSDSCASHSSSARI